MQRYLTFALVALAAATLPGFFGLSTLHGIALALFILLLVTIQQLDELGAVVSELKRDLEGALDSKLMMQPSIDTGSRPYDPGCRGGFHRLRLRPQPARYADTRPIPRCAAGAECGIVAAG